MKLDIIALVILCALTISCSKDFEEQAHIAPDLQQKELDAEKEFALILSKAICSDADIRSFIKQEALKQFDNDYDVFYPIIKDVQINEKGTFRDILCSFSEDQASFHNLESTLKKLTFLVPDWSWITNDCFSVKNWDTSEDFVCVGYDDRLCDHPVYYNGTLFDTIKSSEVTCYPIIIVKSNERIKEVVPATKGSPVSYEFVSEAFDGSKRCPDTKSTVFEHDLTYDGRDNSNFVPSSALFSDVVAAYNEFGTSWQNAAQRDYIYFGMSKSKTTNGIPNTYIRERLYRFKISPSVLSTIKGPTDSDYDPDLLRDTMVYKKTEGNAYLETIMSDQKSLWADGAYEINFQAYVGENRMPYGNNTMNITVSIHPDELWYLNHTKVTRTSYRITNFKYKFEFNPRDLESKWYYFNSMIFLPYWDLENQSYLYWFTVGEWDLESTTTIDKEMSYSYTSNVKVTGGINAEIPVDSVKLKLSLGVEYTAARSDVEKTKTTVTISQKGYTFGTNFLDYSSNVISSGPTTNNNGDIGYYVNNVSLGDVELTLLPCDVRF